MIHSISFCDHKYQWFFQDLKLGQFNLLVGVSGVGKTRTLQAIRRISTALPTLRNVDGCEFTIQWKDPQDHCPISWSLHTQANANTLPDEDFLQTVMTELLQKKDNPYQATIVQETIHYKNEKIFEFAASQPQNKHIFRGKDISFMASDRSALSSLVKDADLSWISEQLHSIFEIGGSDSFEIHSPTIHKWMPKLRKGIQNPAQDAQDNSDSQYETLEKLQESTKPFLDKCIILFEQFPDRWQEMTELYQSLFDENSIGTRVEEIKIGSFNDHDSESSLNMPYIALAIRVNQQWIPAMKMSAGMRKALTFLLYTVLLPDGSTVLIDEIENSLGTNCLNDLLAYMQNTTRLQFVITSHHPTILNAVPLENWLVVTNKNTPAPNTDHDLDVQDAKHYNQIIFRPALSIPALQNVGSRIDRYDLLNSAYDLGDI